MNIKKFLPLLILSASIILPANADIIWPSLYIAKGMLSIKTIILGFIFELLFVKYFTKSDWKKSAIITAAMNLITTALGIILIPLSGLCSELVFDLALHTYDKFGIGTFHWSHWLASYMLVIIINTLIEGLFIKLTLKIKFKQSFWWLFAANSISVLLCFICLI